MKQAILKTFIYADLFDFPLTRDEIWQRLIWKRGPKRLRKEDFDIALERIEKEKRIEKDSGLYFLLGRTKIVRIRKKRGVEAIRKFKIAKKIAKILKVIPTIKFVGLTGSVAAKNAERIDDIDLFIISSSGWLWTTRFFTTLLLSILGVRRKPGEKKSQNKICLNMFLDEDHLDVFVKDKDLFLAYEIYQLKLLWQRGNIYQKFIRANLWVKDFLPNAEFD